MPQEQRWVSRDELYQMVWSEALVTLAPKLGLSDVGLAKACRRMEIPVPWRGYWAKKAAGHRVPQTPLPKVSKATVTQALVLRDRQEAVPRSADGPAEPPTGPVADQQRFEADAANAIVVGEELTHPHPLVAATVRALRGAKVDADGLIEPKVGGCLNVRASIASADRVMRIMNAFVVGCEVRGWAVSVEKLNLQHPREGPSGYESVLRRDGRKITFRLTERTTRKPRPEKDKAGHFGRAREWVYEPSGILLMEFEPDHLGARTRWADGTRQRLEELLNPMMIGLVDLSERIKAWRARLDEQERRREEERRRRDAEEAKQRALAEHDRVLDDLIGRYERAARIRRYVAALEARPDLSDICTRNPSVSEWIDWCKARADDVDSVKPHLMVPTSFVQKRDRDVAGDDEATLGVND